MNAQAETIATMPTQNEESSESLLQIRGLKKRFSLSGDFLEQLRFKGGKLVRHQEYVHAINGVNLDIKRGEALCVVGESGCGKSTVARTVMGLISPSEGEIRYDGQRIDDLSSKQLLPYRKRMQMIFQNPYASLNPRMTIQQTLEEPLRLHHPDWNRQQILDKVEEVMRSVGIDPDWGKRFGHEFSGGQRQRIALARALILKPALIVLDEPTSALDRAVQSQMIDLLLRLQETHGLTYLFISHDLRVVRALADEIIVMRSGRVVEQGEADRVFSAPENEYTRSLIKAAMDFEVWNDAALNQ